jgi:hypothetical protein
MWLQRLSSVPLVHIRYVKEVRVILNAMGNVPNRMLIKHWLAR